MKVTIGNAIDRLTICNIRIWMAEDIKRKKNATDKEIADATRITNIANVERNKLIQAIDEEINFLLETGTLQENFQQGSTKMYNSSKK